MKDWLTIGQFSKKVGVSAKALRIYEKMGILRSHSRGDNGYRYYQVAQLPIAYRLKDFKELGFSLNEIKELLATDVSLDPEKLAAALSGKLELLSDQQQELASTKAHVERILTSLHKKTGTTTSPERKYTMSLYDKVSIVVTGVKDLEDTAGKIQSHLECVGQKCDVMIWDGVSPLTQQPRPSILVIPENLLDRPAVRDLHPDVIVVRNLSSYTEELIGKYLNLFQTAGAHLSTIINADDRASIRLASEVLVKKGAIYYFSKNSGLEKQIRNIGGIVSDGEEITVYAFNRTAHRVHLKLPQILAFDEEVTLLSSLAAVMDLGIPAEKYERVLS